MEMKIGALLFFIVGCWGTKFKAIDQFKEAFEEHTATAEETISSIENILETSRSHSELFFNKTYSNNPILKSVTDLKLSNDTCYKKFIDNENLKLSFEIQVFQLQVPLRNRILDIRERLSNINYSIDIYQKLAENKYQNCEHKNCTEEINEWLESSIDSLSCAIYPECSNHFIRKRSTCPLYHFQCSDGNCIHRDYFCNGNCDCGDCSDELLDCTRSCTEFRCGETWRCIPYSRRCNGIDECGDGTDEEGCPITTTPSYTHSNCSVDAGDFLCLNKKCIALEKVCDGNNDCRDWSDESDCKNSQCSSECGEKGGVCLRQPEGPKCLYECPPGTYETSEGCSRNPEAPLPNLIQVLEDTPRLTRRYVARLKFLETKATLALSRSLREVAKCKKEEFTLLSRIIHYSPNIHEERPSIREPVQAIPAINNPPAGISDNNFSSPSTEETFTSTTELYEDMY